MTEYANAHNEWIKSHNGHFSETEMQYHLKRLDFLMHERAMHLPVMLISIAGFLLIILLAFLKPSLPALLGVLLLTILTFCYIKHYFFLENTCQDWQKVYSDWKLRQLSLSPVEHNQSENGTEHTC